ncbi:MAG: histidine kinase [Bacteroidales bacterium]|nr:histidine kinase [Bacteroidales bacterium]
MQTEVRNGSRSYVWLLHIAIWAVLFGMPFFSPRLGHPLHGGVNYSRFIPVLVSFLIIFYVNYFLLIKKYLFNRKFGLFILWNLLLIALVSFLVHLVFKYAFPAAADIRPHRHQVQLIRHLNQIVRNSVSYLGIVCVAVAIRMTGRWYRDENKRKETEMLRAETELANLKSQINPHFLFNTLNNIYSLIGIDQTQAQEAVHDLSGMMRYLLYESEQPTVSLASESAFLKDYVKLMSLRLPEDRVRTEVSLAEGSGTRIAPMLFISLVENAFKHGISDTEESFVRIDLHEDGDYVVCTVENSCFPKDDNDRSGSGIGLKNLRRRLEMLYPDKYAFECGPVRDIYQSILKIKTV